MGKKKYDNEISSVAGLGGRASVYGFLHCGGQRVEYCWTFVENEASFDFCPCLWTYLTECTEKVLKNKLSFFFSLWNKIWGEKKDVFFCRIDVLRGLSCT